MKRFSLLSLAAVLSTCAWAQSTSLPVELESDRKPKIQTGGNVLLKGAKVYTISGPVLADTDVLILKGKIAKIGKGLTADAGVKTIDVSGKILTPGIIDAHSHRGEEHTNEWMDSIVAEVQIRDVVNPDQEGLWWDVANGITSGLTLHGSADAIGGQSIIIKHKWKRSPAELIFPGAPRMIKFALGENVTSKNGSRRDRFPTSRMGVEATMRRGFEDARAYMKEWDAYNAGGKVGVPPRKDVRLETLADILRGKIWVQCHSYKQSEMLMLVRLSQEFGFKVGAMQHALESYKIAPELAKANIPVSMFSEGWAYKLEVFEAIPMGVALCLQAGVLASVNTDTFSGIAPLMQDAAKQMRYGIDEATALKTITINPAKQLGIDSKVGTIEVGKDGDIAIWDGHPLSIYSRCAMTLIDGEVEFTRRDAFGVDKLSTFKYEVRPTSLTSDLAPLPKWSNCYAIVDGMVHPISGADIPEGRIVFRDGKIVAVGDKTLPIPGDAAVISAKGKHVFPGFIDGGSNLGLNEMGLVRQSTDDTENGAYQADLKTLIAFDPDSVKIGIARSAGVTTSFVAHNAGPIAGQGAVVNLAGYNREQMALNPASGLLVDFPSAPSALDKYRSKPEEFEKRTKEAEDRRADLKEQFKLAQRYLEARAAGTVSPDPRLDAYEPYLKGEKPTYINAQSEETIRAALSFAKEFKLKAVISGGAESWKVAKQLAEANVPVIYSAPGITNPTSAEPLSPMDPYDSPFVAPTILRQAGVKFCILGGDASYLQNLTARTGWLCAFGLPREAALRAITLDAAQILGVGDKVGSLEVGKLANVVVTDGDPLEITTQVENVFIGGKPVSLSNHFTQLYRKFQKRLKQP